MKDFSLFRKQCFRNTCLECRKNTESKNPKVVRTKIGRIMLLSKLQCVTVENRNLSKRKKLVDY